MTTTQRVTIGIVAVLLIVTTVLFAVALAATGDPGRVWAVTIGVQRPAGEGVGLLVALSACGYLLLPTAIAASVQLLASSMVARRVKSSEALKEELKRYIENYPRRGDSVGQGEGTGD